MLAPSAARRRLAALAAIAMTAVLFGRDPASAKEEALAAARPAPIPVAARCFRHPLVIGMSEHQLLDSDWCYPNRIRESTNAPGVIQYWFYGPSDERSGAHSGMVLIDHGVVTYFRDNHGN